MHAHINVLCSGTQDYNASHSQARVHYVAESITGCVLDSGALNLDQ